MFEPRFLISNNVLRYIGRIEACKEVIDHAPLVPAWEAKFRENAFVRSVHHGTHLEGNELTLEQTERLVKANATNLTQGIAPTADESREAAERVGVFAKQRDIQEVLNYRSVLEWIDDQDIASTGVQTYTSEMLKQIHRRVVNMIVPQEQVGGYRKQQVVVRSVDTGEVVFRPPFAIEVPKLIEDCFAWINSAEARELHPVIRAGILHYELVRVHPFTEGNGRTARAIAMFLLYTEGYDIKRFFSIEEYFDRDIEEYYRALLSVQKSEKKDMTYWLEYFSYGLAIELDKIKEQVLKLSQDMRLKARLGTQVALSERQIMLLELLQQKGELTTSEANEALPMVSTDTILRDLKDLMHKGILRKHGVTKGVLYKLIE
ncbi:MAG TPA: Fic family protein [Candidatus Saccharimonadia bacterium]|nr:Fic family protein [Candidatus Saccharimonadia bacterium]